MTRLSTVALLACVFALLAPSARAEVPVELCAGEPKDVSAELPPVRNQGGLGFCYAFAATAVTEQYACRVKSPLCREALSPGFSEVDAMSQYGAFKPTQFGNPDDPTSFPHVSPYREGGIAKEVLERLKDKGQCTADLAPYPTSFAVGDYFKHESRLLDQLRNFFDLDKTEKYSDKEACEVARQYAGRLLGWDDSRAVGDFAEKMVQALVAQNAEAYVHRVLIRPECVANRHKLPPYDVKEGSPDADGVPRYQESVFRQLGQGKAIALSIHVSAVFKEFRGMSRDADHHAVTIVGYRKVGGRCQLKIRNSWGPEWQAKHDDGWFDAQTVLGSSYRAAWVDPK